MANPSSSAVRATTTKETSSMSHHSSSLSGEPTKTLAGLEASTTSSQGVAAAKAAGSWLAFLGLGLGIVL